ncbi:hypothetical protein HanXRQr2_Chr04g0148941 [Helianthus annuus]|uniref:Uncharacterized protein n=1 Tax=Helianthus annuus TaxID=4232 RepID=A0A9K3J4S0_HELAN|nr:hypothetical protein HanXRQr2_Chr04g0148941 [Helianthus annuus]KAJ0929915.1 hypothetical protein HanPSC8_Chr04g0143301 [Helianthus annuus]
MVSMILPHSISLWFLQLQVSSTSFSEIAVVSKVQALDRFAARRLVKRYPNTLCFLNSFSGEKLSSKLSKLKKEIQI